MRRAGLDYHEYATMRTHKDWQSFLDELKPDPARLFLFSTHATASLVSASFQPGDLLVFGSETKGLDKAIREQYPAKQCLRLPLRPENRSLNLSNAVAIAVYEAWRQNDYLGST